jgi:GntR family transcriptional regulator
MLLEVNFKSGLPVYLQIVEQVKAAAASGALRPGDPLPGIRSLAEELRVNRNTVAKAYTELESEGVIETAAGKGCFVKDGATPLKKDARNKALGELLDAAIVQAHHYQVEDAELLKLFRQRLDAFAERKQANEKPE